MLSWVPHGHCFAWAPEVYWPWIISEVVIFVCYTVAFVGIFAVTARRINVDPTGNLLLFLLGAFVFFCGIDHAVGAIQIHYPIYRVVAVSKVLTAVISMAFSFVGLDQLVVSPWRARRNA